jgi:hypothetical protein
MAVELDSDERARVEAARLPQRPSYYNAASLQDTTISQDFEAFLILQDAATIGATLAWLTTTGLLANTALTRSAVAFEALIVEQQDTADQLGEVEESTTAFNAWRAAFQAGKFSDTSEVGLIIRDLQAQAAELFNQEARLVHRRAVANREQDRQRQGISNAQLRELQSWPTPLLSY